MKEEDIRKRDVFNQYLDLVHQDVKNFFRFENFKHVPCPACGSTHYEKQFDKIGFSYVQCELCSTLFVNPRPDIEVLDKFYSNSPSTTYWINEFFLPVAEIRKEKIFKPRAELIAEQIPYLQKAKIGDIGAGFGLFLEELEKVLPDADLIAIEPSEKMVDICKTKELKVIPKMLENVDSSVEGNFDLLTSFELFEHLYEPEVFLQKICSLLKPGGYFFMTTINGLGFDIQLLWEKSKSVTPPHHLNFLNPKSIAILFEKTGFEIVNIETPGKLDWDIVEGMHRNENVQLDRFWGNVLDSDEKVKNELQQWLSNSKFSSHMRIIARRGAGRMC